MNGSEKVLDVSWDTFLPLINKESKDVFDRYIGDLDKYRDSTKVYRLEEELEKIEVSKGITILDYLISVGSIENLSGLLQEDTSNILKLYTLFKDVSLEAGRLPTRKPYATKSQVNNFLDTYNNNLLLLLNENKLSNLEKQDAIRFLNMIDTNKDLFINNRKVKIEYYKVGRIPKVTLRLLLHALKFQLAKRGVSY